MMSRQIRVEKITVSLLVVQSKFNPYKREIVYRYSSALKFDLSLIFAIDQS